MKRRLQARFGYEFCAPGLSDPHRVEMLHVLLDYETKLLGHPCHPGALATRMAALAAVMSDQTAATNVLRGGFGFAEELGIREDFYQQRLGQRRKFGHYG